VLDEERRKQTMTTPDRIASLMLAVGLVFGGCNKKEESGSVTPGSGTAPTSKDVPASVIPPTGAEPTNVEPTAAASTTPTPPQLQSPQESARAAFSAQRFEEVCQYLIAARFSPEVCDYLARTARGVRTPPPRMDAWLASQGVRLLNGAIVGPEDPSRNEYEVLVDGEPTLLIAEFTQMESDLIEFEFWAQEIGSREVKMAGGRMRALPLYREWPLYVAIVDIDGFEGDQRAGAARELLEHLVGEWERLYAAPPGAPPPSTPPPPVDAEALPATTTACVFPRAA
jgi:hypothetical protein